MGENLKNVKKYKEWKKIQIARKIFKKIKFSERKKNFSRHRKGENNLKLPVSVIKS